MIRRKMRKTIRFLPLLAITVLASSCGGSPDDDSSLGAGGVGGSRLDASDGDAGAEHDSGTAPDVESDAIGDSDVPFTEGVSTLAGWSEAGYVDGPRGVARFWNPVNVAYRDGQVYVADFDNGKIRSIGAHTYFTSSIDLGPGFRRPFGLAFASDETLYVSTDSNPDGINSVTTGTIWRVNLPTKTAHVVKRDMGRPRGIAVLPGDRIAATDFLHHVVEIIDPNTAEVTVIAGVWDEPGMADGAGSEARFDHPCGIGVIGGNTLVIADSGNSRIRAVTLDGIVSTFAGSGEAGYADGSAESASFNKPLGLSVASGGKVYVADSDNYRVRLVSDGQVTTIAGNGQAGYADDDDPLAARFYGLEGLAATPDGETVYVADGNHGEEDPYNRVRQVQNF